MLLTICSQTLLIKANGEIVRSGFNGVMEVDGSQLVIRQSGNEVLEVDTIPGFYLNVKKGDIIKKGHHVHKIIHNCYETYT